MKLMITIATLAASAASAQPVITRQPANLSLSIGAAANFRVTVTTSQPPLSYQWRRGSTLLVSATNASLTLTNIQTAHAGAYTVAVRDKGGTIESNAATLDVDPAWTKITSDPIVTDPDWKEDFVAVLPADYDRDGDLDLVMIRPKPLATPIFLNDGNGAFTQIFDPSLQSVRATAFMYSWGDYDNDGYPDLFVPSLRDGAFWKNLLLHNNGAGAFEQVTNNPVASQGGMSYYGAWGDYDRDGDLDLLVANGNGELSTNWFYQNDGAGVFLQLTNSAARPFLSGKTSYDVVAVWTDVDGDGWQDLFVPTSPGRNSLFRNDRGSAFNKVMDDPLVTEPGNWGDAAWADYDNDGDLDVFLTTFSAGDQAYTGPVAFFQNDGAGHFKKMTASNVGPLANERVNSFSAAWADYDNDGWLDLYLANGVYGSGSRPDLLYRNNGEGTFTKVVTGSPATEPGAGWGGWLVDLNHDGFLDILTFKHAVPDNSLTRYYRNNGNSNNWLCVNCVGTASPRFGNGTKVRVKATIRGQPSWQLRVIDPGGFVNAQNVTAHFGLDDATTVEVLRIEWTSGLVQELRDVPAKQFLTVTEPAKLATARAGQLQVQCWKGMACRIETSPDLVDWTPLTTVTNTQLCGGVQCVDPMAHGQSARFYRAVQTPDFAHPEALASTAWLEQHLADPQVRIVDCRYPQSDAAFKAGHIPGAVKVDVTDLADPSSSPRMLVPTKAQFESLMGRLGISNSTTVVAYDTDGGLWCARLWWALRYYGHENVKLLQGGLGRWRTERRPLEKTVVSQARAVFQAEPHPEWRATFADVQAAVGSATTTILDALSEKQHTGEAPESGLPLPAGHIPSAKNVPASSNLDTNDLLRLPVEALAGSYTRLGVTPDKEVITYCGGGYYGAFSLFVLYQLGYEHIRLYDGSWADWTAQGGTIEKGP